MRNGNRCHWGNGRDDGSIRNRLGPRLGRNSLHRSHDTLLVCMRWVWCRSHKLRGEGCLLRHIAMHRHPRVDVRLCGVALIQGNLLGISASVVSCRLLWPLLWDRSGRTGMPGILRSCRPRGSRRLLINLLSMIGCLRVLLRVLLLRVIAARKLRMIVTTHSSVKSAIWISSQIFEDDRCYVQDQNVRRRVTRHP